MITRNLLTDLIYIFLLGTFQIVILNRVTIFGIYTPVMYPLFVMFYPFLRSQFTFLGMSFLLGLGIDAHLGTWGINTFATTTLAYFRIKIFRNSTESTTDFFSFQSLQWNHFAFFIFFSILIHQFIVQFLEFFKLQNILYILLNILITSGISFLFILLFAIIFRVKKNI